MESIFTFDGRLCWKREGQKSEWHFGIEWEHLCERYECAYILCGASPEWEAHFGVDMIKWLIWDHEDVSTMTQAEVRKYMRANKLDDHEPDTGQQLT